MLFKSLKVMAHQKIFKKMSNEKIDLSIIIPSYNEKNNLKFLINKSNKLISKNKTLEIILVDNGSTDGSKNFLQFLQPPSTRLKIVRVKKNIGYGYGIKYGLKHANGEIVSWNINGPTNTSPLYWDMPFFDTEENLNPQDKNSFYGRFGLTYDITDDLNASVEIRKTLNTYESSDRFAFGGRFLDRSGICPF